LPLGTFYPKPGQVLICDFERGFIPPEMVKRRPVVVISRAETHGRRLCTVVPFSTTAPEPTAPWHVLIANNPLPDTLAYTAIWAKCDMLYTVSFDRLDKPHRKTRSGREYLSVRLAPDDLAEVLAGVRAYLGMG
jgi:uncharacterized protein YifN (PemK superfamily)